MVFTQHININNMQGIQEFIKICTEHPECKECPLKEDDINLQGVMTKCETGKTNR